MKERLKEPKGITLIALIITIIILLILAMVSIGVIKEEGIIKHAENAADTFNKAKDNQTEQISLMEQELNKYGNTQTETTKWWEATETEKKEFIKVEETGNMTMVAFSNNEGDFIYAGICKGSDMKLNKEESDIIYIMSGGVIYIFCTEDNSAIGGRNDFSFTKEKWYVRTNDSVFNQETTMEYTGPSPIQLSEFSDDEIFCKTYLERIINSFNN